MTKEQQLALDCVELYIALVQRLRELQKTALAPTPSYLLLKLEPLPHKFLELGHCYFLDFRRQIYSLKSG